MRPSCRSYHSHAGARKKSASSPTVSFMYRHPLLFLCLVLFTGDAVWLSWLYSGPSDCDCPEMAELYPQLQLHRQQRDNISKVLPHTTKVNEDKYLPKKRPKIPKHKPNKKAYQDLVQKIDDPSLLTKLPELPFNQARTIMLRKSIWQKTQIKDYLYASKKNMPLGSVLPFFEGRNKSTYYMVPEVYRVLPEDIRWPRRLYQNCSVVGNGGILLNSGCGPEIDSTQYVLRSNAPPLKKEFFFKENEKNIKTNVEYYKDVGSKANLVSLNPSAFEEHMYGFKKEDKINDFIDYLSQYEDEGNQIWTHMFHYDSKAKLTLHAIMISQAMGSKSEMVSSHPRFLQAVNDFWKDNGLTGTRASSGLVFTTVAVAMCKETHLYGYWPFPVDYDGREVPYHYYLYDYKHTQNNTFHKLPEEFALLQKLHRKGVVKMHIGKCKQ